MGIKKLTTLLETKFGLSGTHVDPQQYCADRLARYTEQVSQGYSLPTVRKIRSVGFDLLNIYKMELSNANLAYKINSEKINMVHVLPQPRQVAFERMILHAQLLMELGIRIIVVCDGNTPDGKLAMVDVTKASHIKQRKQAQVKMREVSKLETQSVGNNNPKLITAIDRITNDVHRSHDASLSMPQQVHNEIKKIYTLMGVTFLNPKDEVFERSQWMEKNNRKHPVYSDDTEGKNGQSEGDQFLATLFHMGHIDLIISTDTDFLSMNCDMAFQKIVFKSTRPHAPATASPSSSTDDDDTDGDAPSSHTAADITSTHKGIRIVWENIWCADDVYNLISDDMYKLVQMQQPTMQATFHDKYLFKRRVKIIFMLMGSEYMNEISWKKPDYELAAQIAAMDDNLVTTLTQLTQHMRARGLLKNYQQFDGKIAAYYWRAYLFYNRLPYELDWISHIVRNRSGSDWFPTIKNDNISNWSLHTERGDVYCIGSIPPKPKHTAATDEPKHFQINTEAFFKALRNNSSLPNYITNKTSVLFRTLIDRINHNFEEGLFWHKLDTRFAQDAMVTATYTEDQLEDDLGETLANVDRQLTELRNAYNIKKQQRMLCHQPQHHKYNTAAPSSSSANTDHRNNASSSSDDDAALSEPPRSVSRSRLLTTGRSDQPIAEASSSSSGVYTSDHM